MQNDTRDRQFLCPMTNQNGISQYRNSCPPTSVHST
jgi:hypothetical protein